MKLQQKLQQKLQPKIQHKSHHLYLAGIALLLVGGVGIQVQKRVQASHAQPKDPRVQAEALVLDQVEPLCRTLLPGQQTLHFSISKQDAYFKSGGDRPMWAVDCMDSHQHQLLHLLWDGTLNHLVIMSRKEADGEPERKAISHAQALVKAQKWASSLNIASANQLATCDKRVQRNGDVVLVRLFPPSCEVMIWVNPRTGNIVNTHVRSLDVLQEGTRYIATKNQVPPQG